MPDPADIITQPVETAAPAVAPVAEYRLGVPVRPNIFVVCMHKAASTFVADVLLPSIAIRTAEYDLYNLGSIVLLYKEQHQPAAWATLRPTEQIAAYVAEHPIPPSNQLCGRIYPRELAVVERSLGCALPAPMQRLMLMRRDPRDALISLYYSWGFSHAVEGSLEDSTKFRETRKQLQSRNLREGLKAMLESKRADFVLCEFRIAAELMRSRAGICDLPYELLMEQPRAWLEKFVAAGELQRYVDEAWYAEMLGHLQPPAVEDPLQHKRRMTPGNWLEVFDDELQQVVEERVGKEMAEFGYTWERPKQLPAAAQIAWRGAA